MAKKTGMIGGSLGGKQNSAIVRSWYDPLGIDPTANKLFGENDGPDYSAEEAAQAQAIADQKAATNDFIASGPARYDIGERYSSEDLGPSAMGSEKGKPNSIRSAPAAGKPLRISKAVSTSGSPAIT